MCHVDGPCDVACYIIAVSSYLMCHVMYAYHHMKLSCDVACDVLFVVPCNMCVTIITLICNVQCDV